MNEKIGIVLVSLLFIPLSVLAADYKVKTLNVKASGTTINYNGTMENGSHAVMCKLYDKDSKEIDLLSSAVDNNNFEGSFEVSNGGEYKVACANYEGGLIMEKTVVVSSKNPKTSDKIVLFASLALISLVGVGYVIFNFNKQVKQK